MFKKHIKRRSLPRNLIQTTHGQNTTQILGSRFVVGVGGGGALCPKNPFATSLNSSGNSGGSPSTIAESCANTELYVSGGYGYPPFAISSIESPRLQISD